MNKRLKVGTIIAGAALAATTLFGGAAAAADGNLLVNGDIFPNTEGWREIGHAELESVFIARAGHLSQISPTQNEIDAWATQCVPIDDTRQFQLSGETKVLPGQERTGHGSYALVFYPGSTCAGVSVEKLESLTLPTIGGWQKTSHTFQRTKKAPAKSVSVQLVVTKHATDNPALKEERFTMGFRDLRLVGWDHQAPKGPQDLCFDDCGPHLPPELPPAACFGAGCPGEEPEEPEVPDGPDGPVACIGCEPDPEEPPAPTVEEPAVPTEPDFPMPPGDEPDDQDMPGAPSSDQPAEDSDDQPTGNGGQPTGNGGQPTSGGSKPVTGGGNPQAKPTLEPQGPGPINQAPPTLEPQGPGPINSASPTPPPPATGGDSTSDPAGDFSNGEGDSAEVERDNGDSDGLPMPLLGGGLAGLLALFGLGIVLQRSRRQS